MRPDDRALDHVIVDLEATCWEKGTRPDRMETIEIGAVRLASGNWEPLAEFSSFVKPVSEPVLSDFCRHLTGIRQEHVDTAQLFPEVFAAFLDWIGGGPVVWCSWGAYDLRQLQVDCRRHRLPFPQILEYHVNLKKEFAAWRDIKPCGMKRALGILGIALEGSHHRAIDDARNIAKIARVYLESTNNDKG
jgi:inhibitor of KinA sporulation pathway (predicted exonuclease)